MRAKPSKVINVTKALPREVFRTKRSLLELQSKLPYLYSNVDRGLSKPNPIRKKGLLKVVSRPKLGNPLLDQKKKCHKKPSSNKSKGGGSRKFTGKWCSK